LHDALRDLLAQPERRAAMEEAARRRVEHAFSYEAVGAALALVVTGSPAALV
jgi:hypothetical protein